MLQTTQPQICQLTVVQDDNQVWICIKNRVLLYISADGTLHAPNDIVACATIPPIPQNPTFLF